LGFPIQTEATRFGVTPLNQASTLLEVVPVLPATSALGNAAAVPVPYCTVALRATRASSAIWAENTRRPVVSPSYMTEPVRSTTRFTKVGA
jgi:hypothetical protein